MCIIGGVLTVISIIPLCWGVGAYMIVVGVFVGLLEASFIFDKVECTKALTVKMKSVKPAHRCIFYIL